MRYFTSYTYEKTQIRGRFPLRTDNKEKWMRQLDEFYNGGHKNDIVLDTLLFKYIPEVKEDILQGKEFTDKEVSEKLYERIKEMANEWKNLCSLYKTEYENIKQKLPLSLQELKNYQIISVSKCYARYVRREVYYVYWVQLVKSIGNSY